MYYITWIKAILVPVFLFAVVIHEYAHGWVAERCGDPTARLSGRLTLNPIPHIDLMGTIILPLMLIMMKSPFIFGWAKPVPIDFRNFHNPKQDIIRVGLAGPLSNIILAILCAFLLRAGVGRIRTLDFSNLGLINILGIFLVFSVFINIILAVFNMIPIPPLDGSRVITGLLPPQAAYSYSKLEPFGFLIIFALFFLGLFQILWIIVMLLAQPLLGTELWQIALNILKVILLRT